MTLSDVSLYHWNPKRKRFPYSVLNRLPVYCRPNNFGDVLAVSITRRVLERHGCAEGLRITGDPDKMNKSLLTVGSILHFAKDGDVVWGSGRNGKIADGKHAFDRLDVRMVRGPLTRRFLMDRGLEVPEVFGDPGILLRDLFPEYVALTENKSHRVTIIPNINDTISRDHAATVQDPRASLRRVIARIAGSELVISSSLHGVVIAESLGVPVRVLRSGVEPTFKYSDYFLGTGREEYPLHDSIADALKGAEPEKPVYDAGRMLAAFPYDLFPNETAKKRP